MKEKVEIDQKEISTKKQEHKDLKELVEMNEFGNENIVLKLYDETK